MVKILLYIDEDSMDMEEELKRLFQRDVDWVTRKGIESSCNYLRRKVILASAQVIDGARSPIFLCIPVC